MNTVNTQLASTKNLFGSWGVGHIIAYLKLILEEYTVSNK